MKMGALSIEDMLALKPGGHFRIEAVRGGGVMITIDVPGEEQEYILCASMGHANAARMQLTDAGLTGYVCGAL